MKSPEYNNAPPPVAEVEHFSDFEAADLALRGTKRIAKEKHETEERKLQELELLELEPSGGSENVEELDEDDYDYDEDYSDYEDYYDWGESREEELEREQKFELFTIPPKIIEEYNLPDDLPDGVAIMGGTARSLARRLVAGDKEPVRDLDLVFIPELADRDNPPTDNEIEALSQKYMPDDYAYGHGIGTEHLESYFGTRDLTINQCLVAGNKLLMTRAAYDDFQENIIRPSYYEQNKDNKPISERMFLKALLLQAVFSEFTDSFPTLEDFGLDEIDREIDENAYDDIRISPFDVALTMNKAMGRGAQIAMKFTENLVDWNIVSNSYLNRPMRLARDARDLCYSFEYCTNDTPLDGLADDPLDYHNLEEEFQGLQHYQSADPAVRAAMREYDSPDPDIHGEPTEKVYRAYTKDDYAWMNREGEYDLD